MNTKEIQQNILKQALADRDASIPGSPEETAAVVKIMDVVFPGYWSKRKHFRYYFDIPGFKLLLSDLEPLPQEIGDLVNGKGYMAAFFPTEETLKARREDKLMDVVLPPTKESFDRVSARLRETHIQSLAKKLRDTKDTARAVELQALLVDMILRFPNKDFLGEINIDQYMDHVGFAEADFKNTLYKSEPMSEEEQAAMLAKYAAQSPSESREDKLKRLLTEFRDTKDEAEAALLKAELVDEICDTDEE